MLDRKYVVENAEAVKLNCLHRGAQADVDRIIALEMERRAKMAEVEEWNRQANEVSAQIGKVPAEQREEYKERGRGLRASKEQSQKDHDALDRQIDDLLARVPNMTHPSAPIGNDDNANLEIARGSTPITQFDFKPKDHLEREQDSTF